MLIRRLFLWGVLTLSFLLPFWPQAAPGEEASKAPQTGKRAILILMDRVNWQDILEARTPNLQKLARHGAVGLINTKTAETCSTENAYMTIGAGKRALAGAEGGQSFGSGEVFNGRLAADLYQGRFGFQPGEENVFNPWAAYLTAQNQETNYKAKVGALGDVMRDGGLVTAIVGNADIPDKLGRQAVTIAMDSRGLVPAGKVDARYNLRSPNRPFGLQTDYDRLLKDTLEISQKADLTVVETGDTYRVEAYRDQLTSEKLSRERYRSIEAIDQFVGKLAKATNLEDTRLIIMTPAPPLTGIKKGNYLTPVLMVGAGVKPGSLIKCDTTRRNGLMTLSDVAPTIISYFGLSASPDMEGRAAGFTAAANNLDTISGLDDGMVKEYLNRLWVLLPVMVLVILAIISALAGMLLPARYFTISPALSRFLLLMAVLAPLSLLIIGGFEAASVWIQVALVLALNLGLAGVLTALAAKPFSRVCLASLLTALFIVADLLAGSRLMQHSPLGYDVILGARYYGIGNEYMGILIGAALFGIIPWFNRDRLGLLQKAALIFSFALVTFLLGSPFLGANVGGTITAVAAFAMAYFKLQGTKVTYRRWLILILAPLAAVAFLILIDVSSKVSPPSHLARGAMLLFDGGMGEIGGIILRKLAMNWRLMQIMGGLPVLVPVLGLLILGYHKAKNHIFVMEKEYPGLGAAFRGLIIGCLVAFLFNDSGIIAAGVMIIFLLPVIIYINLGNKEVSPWNTESLEIRG